MTRGGRPSTRLYRGFAATEPANLVSALPGHDPRLDGRLAPSPPAVILIGKASVTGIRRCLAATQKRAGEAVPKGRLRSDLRCQFAGDTHDRNPSGSQDITDGASASRR